VKEKKNELLLKEENSTWKVFYGLTQRNFNATDKNVAEFMIQKCEDCLLVTRKTMNEGTGSCSVPCRFCGKIWKSV